jgi:hypothetical protein
MRVISGREIIYKSWCYINALRFLLLYWLVTTCTYVNTEIFFYEHNLAVSSDVYFSTISSSSPYSWVLFGMRVANPEFSLLLYVLTYSLYLMCNERPACFAV